MPYLSCENLAVGYEGVAVVSNVNFSLGEGEALFVVGENGAGKSTLLKTVLGLIHPLAGTLRYGEGVSAKQVGYLPQTSEAQRDFPASALEIASSGRASQLKSSPFYSRTDRAAIRNALERAGAYDLRAMPFGVLSGGQQQRVLLARALASEPKLLVLDEPTTGLDPEASESFYETIDEVRLSGAGVMVVTHELAVALPHATHVLDVQNGGAVYGTAQEWEQGRGAAWAH